LKRVPGRRRVFVTADAVGGVWTYALDLARGLAARGDAVSLAVLGPPLAPDQRAEAERIPALRLIETGLPLDWTANSDWDVRLAGRQLAALAHAEGADLVHLNSPALAAGGDFALPVVGACHSCLATWWDAVRGGEPPEDFRWRIELLQAGYAACDVLITPSRAFAEATWRRYGVWPHVVHNGRSSSSHREDVRRPAALAVGRLWDDGKDSATLEAAARLAATPIEAAGPLEGPAGQQASFRAVQALGRLDADAIAARLAQARIFVSPAVYEPFGLSVLEAAQAGCALVLSDIPTFRELWEGAAVFVPPRDPAAFAAAIDRLAGDDLASARLAEAATRRARAYGLEAMVEATAAVHRGALALQPEAVA
jgi:glycosyltransferase involved in cell wall biosynthesis